MEFQRTSEITVRTNAMSATIPPKNRSTDFAVGEVFGGSSNPCALRVHPEGVVCRSMSAPLISINYEQVRRHGTITFHLCASTCHQASGIDGDSSLMDHSSTACCGVRPTHSLSRWSPGPLLPPTPGPGHPTICLVRSKETSVTQMQNGSGWYWEVVTQD